MYVCCIILLVKIDKVNMLLRSLISFRLIFLLVLPMVFCKSSNSQRFSCLEKSKLENKFKFISGNGKGAQFTLELTDSQLEKYPSCFFAVMTKGSWSGSEAGVYEISFPLPVMNSIQHFFQHGMWPNPYVYENREKFDVPGISTTLNELCDYLDLPSDQIEPEKVDDDYDYDYDDYDDDCYDDDEPVYGLDSKPECNDHSQYDYECPYDLY